MRQNNHSFGDRVPLIYVLVFCITLASLDVYAESDSGIQENKYVTTFDVATFFRGDYEVTYVQAYCHVSTMNLQFIKADTAFMASYRTTMTVTDESGKPVFKHSVLDTVTVDTFREIEILRPARVLCFSMELEPGNYIFNMHIEDPETQRDFQLEKHIEVANYNGSKPTISTLSLADRVKPAWRWSPLVKSGYEVHPNVCRVIGPDMDTLFVYAEIYHLPFQDSLYEKPQIRYSVVDENDRIVWEKTSEVAALKTAASALTCIDISDFKPGYYTIILQVEWTDAGKNPLSSSSFLVLKPDLETQQYTRLLRMRFDEHESF